MKNYSKQREEVMDALRNNYDHPTAEEIYQLVQSKQSTASKSTVYRNLKCLSDEKVIRKLTLPTEKVHYDFNMEPHHHLICKKCGKITDFMADINTSSIQETIEKALREIMMRSSWSSVVYVGIV